MRELKAVYFNSQSEAHLLDFVVQLDNFSGWVKERIRESMDPAHLISPEIERYIQDLIQRQITKEG